MTFTTTAMPRPELLEATLKSFQKNLINCDFSRSQLLLNVDPFADNRADAKRAACLEVARNVFGSVSVRLPERPNFAVALKWLWESATEPVIFHLEDDWELVHRVDLDILIRLLLCDGYDHVILRAWTWRNMTFAYHQAFLPAGSTGAVPPY